MKILITILFTLLLQYTTAFSSDHVMSKKDPDRLPIKKRPYHHVASSNSSNASKETPSFR